MLLTGSSINSGAIEKAEARARQLGFDLTELSDRLRNSSPSTVTDAVEQEERRRFLLSFYDGSREANEQFERIIAGNELQQISFLARGALAARPILRVSIRASGGRLRGYGTGFLVGNGVFITNNHVLPDSNVAANSEVEAFFEQDMDGGDRTAQRYALEPQRLFYTSQALDFSIVAVAPNDQTGAATLAEIGWLPLIGGTGKALEGEWLTIVQHPKGERKQICVRENQLLKRDTDVLWYSTDTLGGSSGSPVFNNDWLVVALHHSGVPETRNGRWQTIDGRDFDSARDAEDKVKWQANEGIRVSRIVETLRSDSAVADHPLVKTMLGIQLRDISVRLPILVGDGARPPETLLAQASVTASAQSPTSPQPAAALARTAPSGVTRMSERLVTITLAIAEDGGTRIVESGAREADLLAETLAEASNNVVRAPIDPARDWINGYDPHFLGAGAHAVPLPQVSDADDIAPLRDAYGQTFSAAEKAAGVLKYDGYSIVMSRSRRFAFFSAANVRWDQRTAIKGRDDNWLYDDRIDRKHQVDNSYYARNKFDRGHLTRREDMEYGTDGKIATRRANGTCTWTNCTPQHSIFNQDKHPNKTIRLWHGLERYILEETVEEDQFSVQLFTGPVFGAGDPLYRDIAYPLSFWKVVVAIARSGNLFATGYVLSQKDVIDQFGIEAAQEVPFGDYAMYQRPIRFIEDLTGLIFTWGDHRSMREIDPLETPRARPRRRVRRNEAFSEGGDALESFGDIELD
jgi:endonuclease G, mitochondrial